MRSYLGRGVGVVFIEWAAWLQVVGSGLILTLELGEARMVIHAYMRRLALVLRAPSYVVVTR